MGEKWIKEYEKDKKESFPEVGQPKASEKELYGLRKKLKNAQKEGEILKKRWLFSCMLNNAKQ